MVYFLFDLLFRSLHFLSDESQISQSHSVKYLRIDALRLVWQLRLNIDFLILHFLNFS